MITSLYELLDLFPNALLCAIIMSAVCSTVGVFVILKRVIFISITLSETATCGIAASMVFHFSPLAGALALTTLAGCLLSINYESSRIPRDAVLGFVFLLASSLSIILVSKNGFGLHEIKAMLYGDLIFAGPVDRNNLLLIGLPALILLLIFVRPIFYSFFDRETAQVMGIHCRFWEVSFFIVLSLVVATASKIGGALLVFCYLVVVPATALLLSRNLTIVLLLSPLLGILASLIGLTWSYREDLPGNPTIIVFACFMFLLSSGLTKGINLLKFLINKFGKNL
jgi:ABC-type Mn2+/Zn2+ transport system permease subunit